MNKLISTLSLLAIISAPVVANEPVPVDPNNPMQDPAAQGQPLSEPTQPAQESTQPATNQGQYNAAEEEDSLKTEEQLKQEEIQRLQQGQKIIR